MPHWRGDEAVDAPAKRELAQRGRRGVKASNGIGDRYRATRRAVPPVIVKATSACAPTIAPTSAAARAIAPPVVVGTLVSDASACKHSCSVAVMMRAIVATVSTG